MTYVADKTVFKVSNMMVSMNSDGKYWQSFVGKCNASFRFEIILSVLINGEDKKFYVKIPPILYLNLVLTPFHFSQRPVESSVPLHRGWRFHFQTTWFLRGGTS